MIDPISVGITKEYALKDDKKNPTIWLIGALDSIMKSKFLAGFGKVEVKDGKPVYVQGDVDYTQNNFTLVKYGLKGFKNFKLNDKEVQFKTKKEKVFNVEMEVVDEETLKKIPLFAINELANEIWGENRVGEDLEKN